VALDVSSREEQTNRTGSYSRNILDNMINNFVEAAEERNGKKGFRFFDKGRVREGLKRALIKG